MPGTKAGGLKAAKTTKERYGNDFYVKAGANGGKKSRGGGFAKDPELARRAGAKGGRKSRRGKARVQYVAPEPKKGFFQRIFGR